MDNLRIAHALHALPFTVAGVRCTEREKIQMVIVNSPQLESVHGNETETQSERNSGGGHETMPLFDKIRFETFGERKLRTESPPTLFDQAREAPINFYLSNPDSPPKETKAAYEIPEENRLSTFWKASTYVTHAWAFGLMGVSGGIALTKNPFLRAGCGVLLAAVGVSEAKYSIHGKELKDLKIKESILFPKRS